MALYANGYKVAPVVLGAYEFSNLSGSPYDNTALATALNSKLEGVQVNGTDLTITNKKVNILTSSILTVNMFVTFSDGTTGTYKIGE